MNQSIKCLVEKQASILLSTTEESPAAVASSSSKRPRPHSSSSSSSSSSSVLTCSSISTKTSSVSGVGARSRVKCLSHRVCRRPLGILFAIFAFYPTVMFKSGLENVRTFVLTRPPLVLFLIFLTSVAATLLCLTAYLANNDIRDPSVEYDWNVFLQRFAKIDFCVESRRNGTVFPSYNVTVAPSSVEDDAVGSGNLSSAGFRNFSVNVLLVIHPTLGFLARSNNLTHLSGSVSGLLLGLNEAEASQAFLEVSFELGRNRTLKETMCSKNRFLVGDSCPDVIVPTCAHVRGPASLFPKTSLSPSRCVASSPSSSPGVNGGNPIETHATIHGHREFASYGWGAKPYCPRGPIAHTKFSLDPALTVFLGVDDRSVINLHLLHTSFFLLIMVFSVFCVAAVKSHSKMSSNNNSNNNNNNHVRPSNSKSSVLSGNDQRGEYSLVA